MEAESEIRWNAREYDAKHAYIWQLGRELLDLLSPRPGERILDLGCGTGHLAARIAATGADVTGIDLSPEMVAQARANYPALRFEVADGRDFHFPRSFDAVFSNAAIHWMKEPSRVAASVRGALKPGGRFVAEMGGKGNLRALITAVWAAREAAGCPAPLKLLPWYFPDIVEFGAVLQEHGLSLSYAALFDRSTPLDGGVRAIRNWLAMFAHNLVADVPEAVRDDVAARVEDRLRGEFFRDGTWFADYRRLRLVARAQAF